MTKLYLAAAMEFLVMGVSVLMSENPLATLCVMLFFEKLKIGFLINCLKSIWFTMNFVDANFWIA